MRLRRDARDGDGRQSAPFSRRQNAYEEGGAVKVHRRSFPRNSIWPLIIKISLGVTVVSLVVVGILLLTAVNGAKSKASQAVDSAKEYLSAAKDGDAARLEACAEDVSVTAHELRQDLSSSTWELIAHFPLVGSDVQSVRVLSEVLVDVADNALEPMAQSGYILELSNLVDDGTINTGALSSLLAALDEAEPVLNRAAQAVSELPPSTLQPVANVVEPAKEAIVMGNDAVMRMKPLFPHLPMLLGANGEERNYLVLAQNNAEMHAIGGFVGALGILKAQDGKIEMGDFAPLDDYLSHEGEISGATAEEVETFTVRCDTHHGDHNIIPDFERVGEIYSNAWYQYQNQQEVDGVFGFDPVFLQYLLAATGPIETSFGVTVDDTNAAAIMLNQSLFWWDANTVDEFNVEIAKQVFSKVFGDMDNVDMLALLKAIFKAGDEERCLIWVNDPAVEEALIEAGFAGEMPHDEKKPVLGVYMNDGSVSKFSYYVSIDVELANQQVNQDGSSTYDVTVTFKNNIDPDAYESLPSYSIVHIATQRSILDLYEEVYFIAPEDGVINDISIERLNTRGDPAALPSENISEHSYQGLDTWRVITRLDAQEEAVVSFKLTTSPEAEEPLAIRKTPVMPPEIAYWNQVPATPDQA